MVFMNFFRICGDMCHLLSFVVMFWKLHSSKSVAGISLKTQELYVIVFVARYLDLFWNFLSIYNWVRPAASRPPPPPPPPRHTQPALAISAPPGGAGGQRSAGGQRRRAAAAAPLSASARGALPCAIG